MSVTAKLILDTRRMKLKSKSYPVKLRVTYQREPIDYQTVFDLSKEEYERLSAPRLNTRLQEIKDKLKGIQRSAEDFINELDMFSFYEFERDFISNNKLFKERKKLKKPDLIPNTDSFDFSPYLKRFPI